MYEAGVAEIYDYSMTGPDPLRELIQHFGLQTIPMDAEQVQLDGELLNDVPGMRRKYGAKTADAIEAFRKRCTEMVSPIEYYEGVGAHDNEHPWAYITCEELLDREVDDPTAKRFFKTMARSDLATESHNTNGLNALKNFVMDVDGYIGLYSIQNGNEQLIECLQSEVDADIELNHRVLKVGKTAAGRYQLNMMNGKGPETRDFDLVLMCLPHSWLATMRWEGEQLRKSMVKHIAYFDRPAHYLRVSILFDAPFWGDRIPGAWFMSEAFGGCCVYNEGARHDVGKYGVAELADRRFRRAGFRQSQRSGTDRRGAEVSAGLARRRRAAHFAEGKIDRWLSSVKALPGGTPSARRDERITGPIRNRSRPGRGRRSSVRSTLTDCWIPPTPPPTPSSARRRGRAARAGRGRVDSRQASFRQARVRQDRSRLLRELSRARSVERSLEPVYRSGRSDGPHQDRLESCQELQKCWWRIRQWATGGRVARSRDRCAGHREQPYDPCQDAEGAEEISKLGSIVDMPFKDDEFDFVFETCPCHVAERQSAMRRSRVEPCREVWRDLRIGDVGDGAGADRSLRPAARGQELGTWWERSDRSTTGSTCRCIVATAPMRCGR